MVLSRAFLIEGIVNLVLSLILVEPLGLAGVAIGRPPVRDQPGLVHPAVRHAGRRSLLCRLFREAQLRGLAVGAVVAACGLLVQRLVPPTTWPGFFTGVALTLVFALPFVWLAGLTAEDRELVRAAIARVRPERRPA